MKIGIPLAMLNPAMWLDVAVEADRLGFESLWMSEHLVLPVSMGGSPHRGAEHPPIPASTPLFDAFVYLSHIAARTSNIRLGTYVYNIGLRHPFITARAAATLDIVSGGRLLLGIGASWLREEWDAVGLDFDTRGARVDEAIEVCRRLWGEPVIEHHGAHFDFDPVMFEPKPIRRPGPPLHIGGDGAAALRRAATVGAGWMPMNHTLEQLPRSLEKLRRLCDERGRTDPVEVTLTATIERREDLQRYADAGVDRVIVRPWRRSRDAIDSLCRFAEEVMH